jgi:peptide deformylase
MAERQRVLLVGDPRLRERCSPVEDLSAPGFRDDCERLVRALEQFRSEHGFGRAIAAPQIGILCRIVAMNLGRGPFLLVNPEISNPSSERFTLWDDCMSFPWLMVRVERHLHVDLDFFSENGAKRSWKSIEQAVSELVQHEVDHLDGVLALDRALKGDSVIARQVYEGRREWFDGQVDYRIAPTV